MLDFFSDSLSPGTGEEFQKWIASQIPVALETIDIIPVSRSVQLPTSRFPVAIYAILLVFILAIWLAANLFFSQKPERPRDIGFESVLVTQAAKELCRPKAGNSRNVDDSRVAFVRNAEKNRFEVTLNSESHDGYVEVLKSPLVEGCSGPIQVRTTFEGKVDSGKLRANDKVEIIGRIASITNNGDFYIVITIKDCTFRRLDP